MLRFGIFESTCLDMNRVAGPEHAALARESDLILVQEFVPTEFDWRIGILNKKPIFACQYFMSKSHWQIVKHGDGGDFTEGGAPS